jgi:hypothetical protein
MYPKQLDGLDLLQPTGPLIADPSKRQLTSAPIKVLSWVAAVGRIPSPTTLTLVPRVETKPATTSVRCREHRRADLHSSQIDDLGPSGRDQNSATCDHSHCSGYHRVPRPGCNPLPRTTPIHPNIVTPGSL